jgi:hypothetical protein
MSSHCIRSSIFQHGMEKKPKNRPEPPFLLEGGVDIITVTQAEG